MRLLRRALRMYALIVGVAPGDRRVAGLVDELVVVQVVRRNPAERRVTVEHRQPATEHLVHAAALERRTVVVVVRHDARARSFRAGPKTSHPTAST